jgi:hypothetical protein
MHRLVLVSLAISLASAGCMVGDLTPGIPNQGAGPDAAGDPGPGSGSGSPDAAPAASNCIPASAVIPDGHHNPGQDCLTCHQGQAQGAPLFNAAGTLYTDGQGTSPIAGATIVITDANNQQIKVVSSNNGNFYTGKTIAFPITVRASDCPADATMPTQPQVGDCNSCHGTASRIHLP